MESEQKTLQATSGLVAEAVNVAETCRGAGGHHTSSTSAGGYEAANGISGDTFSGKLEVSSQYTLDAGLFLKGLSVSEAMGEVMKFLCVYRAPCVAFSSFPTPKRGADRVIIAIPITLWSSALPFFVNALKH